LFGRNWKTLVSGIAGLAGTRMHVHDGVEIQPSEPASKAYSLPCFEDSRTGTLGALAG